MIFNADDRKQGTARRYLCNRLSDNVNVYTLEVSMNGYLIKGTTIPTSYTEADCKFIAIFFEISNLIRQTFSDMKIGRNLARALLEYYRFTNILPIPPLNEILCKRKGRSKTNRPKRKFKYEFKQKQKIDRPSAPINYTDLGICYDSDTSYEGGSPVRYPFHSNILLYQNRLNRYAHMSDHFSLSNLSRSKSGNLDTAFEGQQKRKSKGKTVSMISGETEASSKVDIINIPPKPYLSIIDFNLLTRGGLEEATNTTSNRSFEKVCPHHFQKVKSKLMEPRKGYLSS
jgi:hypothetical protein